MLRLECLSRVYAMRSSNSYTVGHLHVAAWLCSLSEILLNENSKAHLLIELKKLLEIYSPSIL